MATIYKRLGRLQHEQDLHDRDNHADVWGPGRKFALQHYALHFGKYAGRLVRKNEPKPIDSTLVDSLLVSLSAANMMHQNLGAIQPLEPCSEEPLKDYVLWADEFMTAFSAYYNAKQLDGDDHMLTPRQADVAMREANWKLVGWVLQEAAARNIDVIGMIPARRKMLRERRAPYRAYLSSLEADPELGVAGMEPLQGR